MSIMPCNERCIVDDTAPKQLPRPLSLLSDALLGQLRANGTTLCIPHHQTIYNTGDAADAFYVLRKGGVRLCKMRANGRRQITQFLFPGDLFGFEEGHEHSLDAEALTDTAVLRVARSSVARIAGDHASILGKAIETIMRRNIKLTYEHLVTLGRRTARERVAFFLLAVADRQAVGQGRDIYLPMDRHDIADYLGLTIETVCRVLTDFGQDGLIAIPNRRQVHLKNLAGLQAAAELDDTV